MKDFNHDVLPTESESDSFTQQTNSGVLPITRLDSVAYMIAYIQAYRCILNACGAIITAITTLKLAKEKLPI